MKDGIENQLQIVRDLLRIGAFLQKTGNRMTGEFGLTQQQFVLLNEIVEKGAVNQKQLVGDLLLEKSNVSKIVNKLQIAELITVSASSDDARSTVLSPTEKGKQLKDECMQRLNTWNLTWLQSLNKNEIDSSLKVLEKLRGLLF